MTASDLIASSSCISCIKMLFGNAADDTEDSPLVLPQNWGNIHTPYVASWINTSKMTHAIRVELEMHQNLEVQEEEAPTNGEQDNSDAESDDEALFAMAGRRSARRR